MGGDPGDDQTCQRVCPVPAQGGVEHEPHQQDRREVGAQEGLLGVRDDARRLTPLFWRLRSPLRDDRSSTRVVSCEPTRARAPPRFTNYHDIDTDGARFFPRQACTRIRQSRIPRPPSALIDSDALQLQVQAEGLVHLRHELCRYPTQDRSDAFNAHRTNLLGLSL